METWTFRLLKGNPRHLFDLEASQVAESLEVQKSSWNNIKSKWTFTGEEERLKEKKLWVFSKVLCVFLDSQLILESGRDKSVFIFLLFKDGSSLFVCSINPVYKGNS